MWRKALRAHLIILPLVAGGCAPQAKPVPAVVPQPAAPRVAGASKLTNEQAIAIVDGLRSAINGTGSGEDLVQYVAGGQASFDTGLRNLKKFLDVAARRDLIEANDIGSWLRYRLRGTEGRTTFLTLFEDPHGIHLSTPLLDYSARAGQIAESIVSAIRENDHVALAHALGSDEASFPESRAAELVAKYRNTFDGANLTWQFVTLDEPLQMLRYEITGTKNGKPAREELSFAFADGKLRLK